MALVKSIQLANATLCYTKTVFLPILIILSSLTSFSAERNSLVSFQRFESPIAIDGIIKESQWESIPPLELVSHSPENGKKATTNSQIRIGYDDNYLYLAATRFSKKEQRQGSNFKRDAWGKNMDQVGLILDTYNDNENALFFVVTLTGSRIDGTMINDASSGEFNLTWDGFWDAEVTQDDKAWYVEMRIPFSSLKFQSIDNEVIMGVSVYSYKAQESAMDTYPAISDKWGFWSFLKPSQAQRIKFSNLNNNRPLYISPYLLSGMERTYDINEEVTGYKVKNDGEFEGGLDIKYAVNDNLTLDVTVNTDFAQVEADDAQINLTRFSLFFPEKRKFFLERASNFNFNFGGPNELFYSRRIGIYEGQRVRILGGARLVGRAGKWDVGFLNLQTGSSGDIPSENFGAYRLRRQIFNSYSYAGGMVTTRLAEDGYYNIAYGLDGIIRVAGDDYFSYNLAQTVDERLNKSISGFDASRFHFSWEKRRFEGFAYNMSYDYSGVNYNPGAGFEIRNDFSGVRTVLSYGWIPGEKSKIQRIKLQLTGSSYFRNNDGIAESVEISPALDVSGKNSDDYGSKVFFHRENLQDTFKLAEDAYLAPGEYDYVSTGFYYNTPQGKSLRGKFNIDAGGFFDGNRISFGSGIGWNISRYLQLDGFYQYNRIKFPSRSQEFLAHIARFKVLVSFNTKLEASSFIQYNSASKTSIANFRLRYNPRDGNDFYLVYNEGDDLNRNNYDFNAPLVAYRAILLKYVHTFRL